MASEVGRERQAAGEERAWATKTVGHEAVDVSQPRVGAVDCSDFARR